jgi:hypothetical protein
VIDLLDETGARLLLEDGTGGLLQEVELVIGTGACMVQPLEAAGAAVEVVSGTGTGRAVGLRSAAEGAARAPQTVQATIVRALNDALRRRAFLEASTWSRPRAGRRRGRR